MADTDPHIDAAHDAGRSGADYDEFLTSRGLGTRKPPASRSGSGGGSRRPPRSRPSPRIPSPGAPSLKRPLGKNVAVGAGTGLAGLFLGGIVYAVLLSVVEYGSAGPGMWFKAKFMNQAPTQSAPSPSSGAVSGEGRPVPTGGSNPPVGPNNSQPPAGAVTQ
jgi:hypothetical protein